MSEADIPPRTMEEVRAFAIAKSRRELAEWDAYEEGQQLTTPRRRTPGPSTVFSVRLDHDEVAALERKAALLGIGPTVLARNYIRAGITGAGTGTGPAELSGVVDLLVDAVAELRTLVP